MTTDEYLEAEKQRQEGLKLAANHIRKRYGPKRKPIVKVRKSKNLFNLLFGWLWEWECKICYQNRLASTWEKAIEQATRHARNHHGAHHE